MLFAVALSLVTSVSIGAHAQAAPPPIPAAARVEPIDPAAATASCLATLPADRKARSDAYKVKR
jgi:hypothetical protein